MKKLEKNSKKTTAFRFITETDTEVLYEGLIHWGIDATLERINGIFSFAFADFVTNNLFCARDHLGVKPLYYSEYSGRFLFSSEAKVFFELGLLEPVLNRDVLGEYLANCWVFEPDTLFKGVKKLEAGCYLQVSLNDLHITHNRYWDIHFSPQGNEMELEDAITNQIVSDVPIGSYFSGGIDSSIIAYCLRNQDVTHLHISVGKFESERVKQFQLLFNTKVDEFHADSDCFELYEKLTYQMDEPIADPAVIPAYQLALKSRELGRIVMLSGMGGDEIDAGYSRHRILGKLHYYRLFGYIPNFLLNKMLRGKKLRDALRLKAFLLNPSPSNYYSLTYYLNAFEIQNLVGSRWMERYQEKIASLTNGMSRRKAFFYLDMKGFLASHNLIYMDKASMAASVEVRVPLLDRFFAASMFRKIDAPSHAGKRRLTGKLKKYLGDEFKDIPKEGFTFPINRWVVDRVDWPNVLSFLQNQDVLNPEIVQKWRKVTARDVDTVAMKLWTIYTLYLWLKVYQVRAA